MKKTLLFLFFVFGSAVLLAGCTTQKLSSFTNQDNTPTPTPASEEELLQQLEQDKDLNFDSQFQQIQQEF